LVDQTTLRYCFGSRRFIHGWIRRPTEVDSRSPILAAICFPPNRFRNYDNSLPIDLLPLPGMIGMLEGVPSGLLPNGNAQRGRFLLRSCARCHQGHAGMKV